MSDRKGMTSVPHPPYSPDLNPSDFFFSFLPMRKVLKGKHFTNVEVVKQKQTAAALKAIKINKLKNCLEQWKKHLHNIRCQVESTVKVTEI